MKLLIGLFLCLTLAGGAWAFATRGPQKLDQLDRLAGSSAGERVAHNIPYGGDRRQTLDIYQPSGADTLRSKPLLVFFYGGSWSSGDKDDYAFAAKAYASQGFVVAVPDYRLSPQVHFPAFVEDAAAAVAKARAVAVQQGADPDRILLAGHSAGGHIALMLALDPQWLKAVAVPAGAIKGVAALSAPTDFYPFTNANAKTALDGPRPELTQPLHFARADAPPLWLGTGADDVTVKPRNSKVLAAAQQKLGGRAIVKEYPDLDHVEPLMALTKVWRGKAPVLADSAAFLHEVAR